MLADDVDAALLRLEQVAQRVLGLVEAARVAQDENRRVVVDDVEVAERRQIRGRAVRRARGNESHGPRRDGRDEQFVVESCRAVGGVGVDVYVRVGEAGARVVAAVAGLPGGLAGLGEGEGGRGVALSPGGSAGFDFFEVSVRVAFDLGFAIEFLFVRFGVFAALFVVGGHFWGIVGRGDVVE